MKKIVLFGWLLAIASITFAQQQMQVEDNNETSSEVDSITLGDNAYNAQLIGNWREITYFQYTVSISDTLIQIQGRQEDAKYIASENQLHIERIWLNPNDPTYFADCNYSIKGDTLHIDNFERSMVSTYPATYMDVTLVRIKDTTDYENLFPTLWGLQRTEVGFYTDGVDKPYLLSFDEYTPTEVDGKLYLCYAKENGYEYYFREEKDRVLWLAPRLGINEEKVLYDWTLEVGDTLKCARYNADQMGYLFRVTDVSTIRLLDGKEYKKWTLSCGTEYIEGIGAINGRGFGIWAWLEQLTVPATYVSTPLVCASKNGQLLYKMDESKMERLGVECLCDGYQPSYKSQWCDTWNILSHGYRTGMPLYNASTMIYQLEGDTAINQHVYTKLVYSYTNHSSIKKWYVGALRFTEDRKIYIYYDNAEYLLYDFDVQVGDRLEIFAGVDYYNCHKTYPHVVTSVDTLDDGRLQVQLDAIVRDEYANQEEKFPKIWIEGVGSIDGIVHNNAILGVGGNGKSVLLCAYRDDECRYTTDNINYAPLGCVYNEGDVINAVKSVSVSAPSAKKIMYNGQLLIIHNDKTYNVMGIEM